MFSSVNYPQASQKNTFNFTSVDEMFSLVSSSRLTFNFHHCHSSVFASPPLIRPPAPSFQPHTPSPLPSTPPFLELCSPSLSLSCPRKGGQRCFGFNWQPQNHNKVFLILRLNIYIFRYSKGSLRPISSENCK